MYEVIRVIGGRRYRYEQESYREDGKVKTRSKYLGPVDGGIRKKRHGGLLGLVDDLLDAAKRDPARETEKMVAARVAREAADYARRDRVNSLLAGETLSLEGMAEVARLQNEPDAVQKKSPPVDDREGSKVLGELNNSTGTASPAESPTGDHAAPS